MKAFAWRQDVTVGQHGTNHDDAACPRRVMKKYPKVESWRTINSPIGLNSLSFDAEAFLFSFIHPP